MAKFCDKCGAKLNPGSRFCPECGAKITDIKISKDKKGGLKFDVPEGSTVTISDPEPKKESRFVKDGITKKKKRGFFRKLITLVLVLCIGVAGYMGFIEPGWFRKDKKGGHDTSHIPSNSPDSGQSSTAAGLVDTGVPSPDADKVSLEVSDCLVEGEVTYDVKPLNAKEDAGNGIKVYSYDITSAQITENLNGFLEIRIPYDDSFFEAGQDPAECLSVHVIDDDGNPQLELFDIDTERKEVVIYAEHLSKRDLYHYKNAPTLEKYDLSFGNAFVGNLSLKECADLTTGFLNDFDQMLEAEKDYYCNKAAITLLLKYGLGGRLKIFPKDMNNFINDTTSWVGNAANILALGGEYAQSWMASGVDAMSKLGLYTSMCKLSYAISDLYSPWNVGGPSRETVLNTYKTMLSTGLDYAGQYFSGGWIGAKFAMSMSGVFVFSSLIDAMFEEAMYQKMYEMGAIYEYFGDTYTDGKYRPRTNKEWYDLFLDIFERYTKANKQDYIDDAIEREIYLYASKFWELDGDEVGNITDAAGYHRMPYPTPDEIQKLTDTYIENLRYRLHPIVLQCERTMAQRAESQALQWLRTAYNKINYKVPLELVDGHEKVQYAGYFFSFDNLADTADRTIWTGQLNDKGRFETKFNLNEWINAGVPISVSLYATEEDREEGKNVVAKGKFIPAKKASEMSTVVFEEASGEYCKLKITRNGVTYYITIDGAIVYGYKESSGTVLGQAKINQLVTVKVEASNGAVITVAPDGLPKEYNENVYLSSGSSHDFIVCTMFDEFDPWLFFYDGADSVCYIRFNEVSEYTETPLNIYEPPYSETYTDGTWH